MVIALAKEILKTRSDSGVDFLVNYTSNTMKDERNRIRKKNFSNFKVLSFIHYWLLGFPYK